MQRFTVHFSGHVQGVGFRATVLGAARSFSVAGYVRNLPDGRVELVAEGEPDQLHALIDAVKEQMQGYIADVSIEKTVTTGELGPPRPGNLRVKY